MLCTVILKLVHLLHTVLLGNDLPLLRFKGLSMSDSLFLFFFNLIVDSNITSRITMAAATTTATATATAMITAIVNQVS